MSIDEAECKQDELDPVPNALSRYSPRDKKQWDKKQSFRQCKKIIKGKRKSYWKI